MLFHYRRRLGPQLKTGVGDSKAMQRAKLCHYYLTSGSREGSVCVKTNHYVSGYGWGWSCEMCHMAQDMRFSRMLLPPSSWGNEPKSNISGGCPTSVAVTVPCVHMSGCPCVCPRHEVFGISSGSGLRVGRLSFLPALGALDRLVNCLHPKIIKLQWNV